ncbi:hypothetical protein ES332_A11G389000v1 [Gossypium tomentosum]|uniref:Homeobox domain-containing protein n=1 Tax=Gossypium tomentosum TaxID=34277 RepID=A0A5D2NJH6_GOSTO|nr:hypothetical protein ES332_A11G389000v1 [Gossypium tomentosum]
MEWENQHGEEEYLQYQIQNGVCGKVMSDEQVEELKKQIVAYSAISEQLAELHKSMSAHHDFTGIRLGNLYSDPISASVGQKITARQRWTPTPLQLQILENIYEQGTGKPSKQKIKEIASELAQHGSVNAEFEPDVSTKDKKTKPVGLDFIDNFSHGVESFYFQGSESGIDQLIGKEESSRGYDPYNNLVEQFGLLG